MNRGIERRLEKAEQAVGIVADSQGEGWCEEANARFWEILRNGFPYEHANGGFIHRGTIPPWSEELIAAFFGPERRTPMNLTRYEAELLANAKAEAERIDKEARARREDDGTD